MYTQERAGKQKQRKEKGTKSREKREETIVTTNKSNSEPIQNSRIERTNRKMLIPVKLV